MSVDAEKLKIFNAALRQAQATRMARIDETSESAEACFDLYGNMYNHLLMEFEWQWAMVRVALTKDGSDPIGDTWDFRYGLPANFFRFHSIDTEGVNEYVIEAGYLLCNEGSGITVIYIASDTALTNTSIVFKRLLEKRMAAALASDLSKDRTLARHLLGASMSLEQMAYRECTDWVKEEAPLSLRAPQYKTGRLPSYGRT